MTNVADAGSAEAPTTATLVGVDLGQSVTDAVIVGSNGGVTAHSGFATRGREARKALHDALAALGSAAAGPALVGVSGGRSASLDHGGASARRIVTVPEPEAIGRGGLELAGLESALVVSCGTGTAMVSARAAAAGSDAAYAHVTGTPVGGGTLRALGGLLLGTRDAEAIAALAATGDASRVDTTLADVLGSGLGSLPPSATAVSLGRLADDDAELGADREPDDALDRAAAPRAGVDRADLAAALVTMVSQTIALVAVNAVRAEGLPAVVMVGRVASLPPVRSMLEAVFRVYGLTGTLHVPPSGAAATALGAALAARARHPAA